MTENKVSNLPRITPVKNDKGEVVYILPRYTLVKDDKGGERLSSLSQERLDRGAIILKQAKRAGTSASKPSIPENSIANSTRFLKGNRIMKEAKRMIPGPFERAMKQLRNIIGLSTSTIARPSPTPKGKSSEGQKRG